MNFTEWLVITEARGAFGSSRNQSQARLDWERRQQADLKTSTPVRVDNPTPLNHTPNIAKQNIRFQNKNQRMDYGKGIEKQIFDSLVNCGMDLRPASTREDMYDKIDGWWKTPEGDQPIQIKYREYLKDILFEVLKDADRGIIGRDMAGKAVYYAVLIDGKINLVRVEDAKNLINQAMETVKTRPSLWKQRANDKRFEMPNGVVLRLAEDPASGIKKMMGYVPVNLLKSVRASCSATVNF